jgi:hypothetical protein
LSFQLSNKKQGQLGQYNDRLQAGKLGFNPRKKQEIFSFPRPTQPEDLIPVGTDSAESTYNIHSQMSSPPNKTQRSHNTKKTG